MILPTVMIYLYVNYSADELCDGQSRSVQKNANNITVTVNFKKDSGSDEQEVAPHNESSAELRTMTVHNSNLKTHPSCTSSDISLSLKSEGHDSSEKVNDIQLSSNSSEFKKTMRRPMSEDHESDAEDCGDNDEWTDISTDEEELLPELKLKLLSKTPQEYTTLCFD